MNNYFVDGKSIKCEMVAEEKTSFKLFNGPNFNEGNPAIARFRERKMLKKQKLRTNKE